MGLGIISNAEQALWEYTTPDGADRRFRAGVLRQLPDSYAEALSASYKTIYHESGLREANLNLLKFQKLPTAKALRFAADDESLRDYAKAHSARCGRLMAVRTTEDACLLLSSIAVEHGLKPPVIKGKVTLEGVLKRLCDEFWWWRQLRRYCGRTAEAFAISIGMVHKHAGIYASNEAVNRRRDQKQRASDLLAALVAINEDGQEFTLEQLAASSVSNPKNKRNELMTRLAGLEMVSKQRGDVALFLTITCPSRMHARYSKSGQENTRYDGTTPREANQYLNKVWSRIRSKFKRDGIEVYGFRVVEPMHDGTPHAHFLLFVSPEDSERVQGIFRTYALQEDGDEPGAKEHRFTVEVIDAKKGTATGYIAKYISKNIDGFGVDKDLYGHNAATSAERVAAWAATWGIRQFQQFGGPSVTVWRELRRMGPQDNPEFEKIRLAADAGQWNEFTLLMGGPTACRKDQPVKLSRLFSAEPGRYGEPKGEQVVGLEFNGTTFLSLKQNWTIICNPVKNRFEIGSNRFQEDEHNCTQGQNRTGTGFEPVMEFLEPVLEPVSERLRNISENSGPGAETGASPQGHGARTGVGPQGHGASPKQPGAGTGPEQLQDFSKSRAHSATSNLEFCQ